MVGFNKLNQLWKNRQLKRTRSVASLEEKLRILGFLYELSEEFMAINREKKFNFYKDQKQITRKKWYNLCHK